MKSWRPAFRPQLETVEDRLPPGSLLGGDATGNHHDGSLNVIGIISWLEHAWDHFRANADVIRPHANADYPNGPGASHPYGQTYGQWAADWWTWQLSDWNNDPDRYSVGGSGPGQSGNNVWLLNGTFSSDPVTHNYTVPAGTALFIPIVNTVTVQFPTDVPQYTVDQLRDFNRQVMDTATNLSATIDGGTVDRLAAQRIQSTVFQFPNDVPADKDALGAPIPAGSIGVDDGYYLMLRPLSVGQHTIHVGATVPASAVTPGITSDVTYNISVTPSHSH
jgi:hypothetical protein